MALSKEQKQAAFEDLALFIEANGVQRTFLHAYAAADALGFVDMLYHVAVVLVSRPPPGGTAEQASW